MNERSWAIEKWHEIAARRDVAALPEILADDVVFESPVVHAPQAGKALTLKYLDAALHVLGNEHFHYVNEWRGERSAVLEFETTIDGIVVNGVDIIKWNAAGEIVEFKVMIRPLKAINLVHERMAAMLASSQRPR
jgi:SnoaL-like domain